MFKGTITENKMKTNQSVELLTGLCGFIKNCTKLCLNKNIDLTKISDSLKTVFLRYSDMKKSSCMLNLNVTKKISSKLQNRWFYKKRVKNQIILEPGTIF